MTESPLSWIDKVAPSGKCDFCSALNPEWIYPTNDFPMPEQGWGSAGAWAACERCSEVIEREDWVKLAKIGERTQQALIETLPPHMRPLVTQEVLKLHRRFREERRGGRRKFG